MDAALWVAGVVVYLGIGIAMGALLDDRPDARSLFPMLIWPAVLMAGLLLWAAQSVRRRGNRRARRALSDL